MGDVLGIYAEELEAAVGEMKAAYEVFAAFVENGFQKERGYLEGMNADFTEKLERTLEIIEKSKLENLQENINNYILAAEEIYREMKNVDDTIAGHMEAQGEE